jgi:HTH-type transcriptional regulator/antitoxin HigA
MAVNLLHIPDYAVAPGETLLEVLNVRNLTQSELAERTGRPLKTINEIIKGRAGITPETAIQFERVLGVSASFWNNLESQYRERLAAIDEREKLSTISKQWIKRFPVEELAKRKIIKRHKDDASTATDLLNFLGVSSPQTWDHMWQRQQVVYRQSPAFEKAGSPEALACWLRIGEVQAQHLKTASFDRSKLRERITALRSLTTKSPADIRKEVPELCSECGVAVVFTSDLPKTYVSGATRWLSPEKALVQLSCRNKRNDSFWFTFFHELGHILLHGKKEIFIDNDESRKGKSKEEQEANEFAATTLVPPSKLNHFLNAWSRTEQELTHFADDIGVHPAIVVGQLQFSGVLQYNQLTHLRKKFDITRKRTATSL